MVDVEHLAQEGKAIEGWVAMVVLNVSLLDAPGMVAVLEGTSLGMMPVFATREDAAREYPKAQVMRLHLGEDK